MRHARTEGVTQINNTDIFRCRQLPAKPACQRIGKLIEITHFGRDNPSLDFFSSSTLITHYAFSYINTDRPYTEL